MQLWVISHSLVILGGHLQTSRIKWTTFPWMSPEWAASWWPCAYKVSSSSPCFSSSSFGVSTYYSTSAGHAQRWERNENTGYSALILLVRMLTILAVGVCFCQVLLLAEEALQPEDRDVAEERKRVLDCQPVVESMVGSPLILQELSKVSHSRCYLVPNYTINVFTLRFNFLPIFLSVSKSSSPKDYQIIFRTCCENAFCNALVYWHASSTVSLPQCPDCTKPVGWRHLLAKVKIC